MRWLKRDRWKAGIAVAGMLLFLVLMVWVPGSAAGAYERALGLATPVTGTVQAMPSVDPTMAALQKEQLAQQVNKLKNDNAWAWLSLLSALGPIATIAAGLLAALYSFTTWIRNRQDEQEKRAEERFQKVVEGLGSERTEAKVGAAIMLRTFLQPGYERFYRQAFDLAVAHLRLRKAEASAPEPASSPAHVLIIPEGSMQQEQQPPPSASIPLDSLSQALITVFKESFPLTRDELKKKNAQFDPQLLDAANVRLDNAYLVNANLAEAWLVRASLRKANLREARLGSAQLEGARLGSAQLEGARLSGADLQGAHLEGAKPEAAASLKGTKMYNVTGLTPEQRKMCIKKGAIFDDVQQTPSSLPATQSNSAQATVAPPAQVNTPSLETDGSSAASSESDSQS
jgi:hypothetical protein